MNIKSKNIQMEQEDFKRESSKSFFYILKLEIEDIKL